MATVNVFEQYFSAECMVNEVQRHAALVMLISTSEKGHICYEAAVTFFPHRDEEDYMISYDAYYARVLYEGKGRRSKKREQGLISKLPAEIDALAEACGGRIFWDQPLQDARYG